MAGSRLVQVRVGESLVWVEAVVPPGTEATSGAADRVLDAFDAASGVVADLAVKAAETVKSIGAGAVRPDEFAVEFGLKIATTGSIVVASSSAEASLVVKLTYKRDAQMDKTGE